MNVPDIEQFFNWRERVSLPLVNGQGKQIPMDLVEEEMRGVGNIYELAEALRRLFEGVLEDKE